MRYVLCAKEQALGYNLLGYIPQCQQLWMVEQNCAGEVNMYCKGEPLRYKLTAKDIHVVFLISCAAALIQFVSLTVTAMCLSDTMMHRVPELTAQVANTYAVSNLVHTVGTWHTLTLLQNSRSMKPSLI